MSRAVFLDRDGTIIEHMPYLSDPEKVVLTSGAASALRELVNSGYLLFLLSNQSGVGRGYFTASQAEACNKRMLDLLQLPEPGFQQICMAYEVSGDKSLCRKPSPQFLLEMIDKYDLSASQCFMVGDSESDVETGVRAGTHSVLIGTRPREERDLILQAFEGIAVFDNLSDFVASLRTPGPA